MKTKFKALFGSSCTVLLLCLSGIDYNDSVLSMIHPQAFNAVFFLLGVISLSYSLDMILKWDKEDEGWL